MLLVYGDTNSTLAGGLAAAQAHVPVAHVEAGMRSFDRAMPEELNRVLTDHLADVLLCPSPTAVANLEREHVAGRVELVGDVMVDVALLFQPRARADDAPLREAGVSAGEYVLATAHRAGNVDDPTRLRALVDLLLALPIAVVLPLHPRTRARLEAAGWLGELEAAEHVRLRPPLGYLAFTALLTRARAVLTDSGGAQKEAYLAGVPCVTHARHDGVGGDGRRRLERARRPRHARRARGARSHPAGRASRALRRRTGGRARRRRPRPALTLSRRRCAAAPRRRPRSAPRRAARARR